MEDDKIKGEEETKPLKKRDWKLINSKYVNKPLRIKREDWDVISANMKKAGSKKFTPYAVRILKNEELIINKFSFDLDEEMLKELKKIGTNINQIAYKLNLLDKGSGVSTGAIKHEMVNFQREITNLNKFINDNKIQ